MANMHHGHVVLSARYACYQRKMISVPMDARCYWALASKWRLRSIPQSLAPARPDGSKAILPNPVDLRGGAPIGIELCIAAMPDAKLRPRYRQRDILLGLARHHRSQLCLVSVVRVCSCH